MADDLVIGQRYRNSQPRPRRTGDPDRIQHRKTSVLDGEFDLHFLAQPGAAGGPMTDQIGENFGGQIFQRWAARVADQVKGGGLAQRVAALALAEVAPGDLRQASDGIDELDHPRARDAAAHALRHGLHHQPECGLGGRALGLAQQAGGGAFPGPGHRAQHVGQLARRVFGEGFLHLGGVAAQGVAQAFGRRLKPLEHVGVEARDVNRIALHEAQIKRIRRRLAVGLHQPVVAGSVEADVEDGGRAAPIGVLGRRAHRDQRLGAEMGQNGGAIERLTGGDGAHRGGGQCHGLRHRQLDPDQPLQALGAPAVAGGGDAGGGGDFAEIGERVEFLHCGT